ncbi:MAG: PUA domain-containing protein [Candidatus Bathyarchaeia archaeon]|nr:pseudouridine synthase [Candidatus Bathyarchaeota archaeon]
MEGELRISLGSALEYARKIFDYQFGEKIGEKMLPDNVNIVFSKRTGRMRYIYLDGKLLAALNPMTGLFTLTIEGARRAFSLMGRKRLWVKIDDSVVPFVEEGNDVFAKHVVDADEEIRPREEVIVIDGSENVIAVGRALLSGYEMKAFKKGVAVKVRKGRCER